MAKLQRKLGATSVVLRVKIFDSTVTTGAGKTGLTNATSGLIVSTIADNEASATAYTSAGSTIDTIATLGTYAAPTAGHCRFKEVDATNHPGVYEIQLPDSRFSVAGAKSLVVTVSGATGAAQCDAEIELTAVDNQSATGFVTSVPAVAGAVASVTGNVGGSVASVVGNVGGSVASVTAPVTVGTNNDKVGYTASTVTDKTGYSLTQSFPANFAAMLITSGGAVALDGSRTVSVRNQDGVTAPTVDDCLVGAWTEAFGKEPTFNSTTWVKQKPDNSGAIRTFSLTVDTNGNVTARN